MEGARRREDWKKWSNSISIKIVFKTICYKGSILSHLYGRESISLLFLDSMAYLLFFLFVLHFIFIFRSLASLTLNSDPTRSPSACRGFRHPCPPALTSTLTQPAIFLNSQNLHPPLLSSAHTLMTLEIKPQTGLRDTIILHPTRDRRKPFIGRAEGGSTMWLQA